MANRYKKLGFGRYPEYDLMTTINGKEIVLTISTPISTFKGDKPVVTTRHMSFAIIDMENSSANEKPRGLLKKPMVGFTDHYGRCIDLVNAMNYAISCGLFEKKIRVDEVRYGVADIGVELYNLRLRTHDDNYDNAFLKKADGTDIVIKYAVIDKQQRATDMRATIETENRSMAFFESYDDAMAFAKAMNYATLYNKGILYEGGNNDIELQF